MKILFLSQVLPYPVDAGPKMRSYFVLRYLAQQHQVTLLTFVRDTDKAENIAHLAEFCEEVHPIPMRRRPLKDLKFLFKSLLTGQPFLIVRDEVPAMTAKIRQLVSTQNFDAVHSDQLWMAQYALAAKNAAPNIKTLLDQHNAVYLIPHRMAQSETNPLKRAILDREANLLTTYEANICRRFDYVVWVTQEDRRAVESLPEFDSSNQPPAAVIPICADPARVQPPARDTSKKRITFLGGLHWPPNAQGIVWFAKEVFPLIRAAVPEAALTVIGKNPPAELTGEGIEVTGYVEDLTPYLAQTAAFVVPLHAGGGMRVKILDAWSWGLPIVSTTIGAEGIEIEPGKDILIADTAPDFAQAVIQLLKDPSLAEDLGRAGRQSVLAKYNWQRVYSDWDGVYGRMRAEG